MPKITWSPARRGTVRAARYEIVTGHTAGFQKRALYLACATGIHGKVYTVGGDSRTSAGPVLFPRRDGSHGTGLPHSSAALGEGGLARQHRPPRTARPYVRDRRIVLVTSAQHHCSVHKTLPRDSSQPAVPLTAL